jgi:CheY-like chemotaxis protein
VPDLSEIVFLSWWPAYKRGCLVRIKDQRRPCSPDNSQGFVAILGDQQCVTTSTQCLQQYLKVDRIIINQKNLLFSGRGYTLLVAKNGDKALRIVRTARPALVLLDIMMPGMDGYEVCKRLKEPPVALTASSRFSCYCHIQIAHHTPVLRQHQPS